MKKLITLVFCLILLAGTSLAGGSEEDQGLIRSSTFELDQGSLTIELWISGYDESKYNLAFASKLKNQNELFSTHDEAKSLKTFLNDIINKGVKIDQIQSIYFPLINEDEVQQRIRHEALEKDAFWEKSLKKNKDVGQLIEKSNAYNELVQELAIHGLSVDQIYAEDILMEQVLDSDGSKILIPVNASVTIWLEKE